MSKYKKVLSNLDMAVFRGLDAEQSSRVYHAMIRLMTARGELVEEAVKAVRSQFYSYNTRSWCQKEMAKLHEAACERGPHMDAKWLHNFVESFYGDALSIMGQIEEVIDAKGFAPYEHAELSEPAVQAFEAYANKYAKRAERLTKKVNPTLE